MALKIYLTQDGNIASRLVFYCKVCICCAHHNVGYLFQVVAVPDAVCSVCGLPSMAKKPEQELNDLSQRSDTFQSQTVSEAEVTVDTDQSSAISSVEIKGVSDSVDMQNTGSSGSCSADSPSMSNAVLSVGEHQEHIPADTEGKTPTEVHQYDNSAALSGVEIKGLSDSVDMQNAEQSGSCSADSSSISNAVLSVDEHQEHIPADTEGETPTGVECHQYDNSAALSDVEIKGVSNLVDMQNTEQSGLCSADSSSMSNSSLSVDEDKGHMLEDTQCKTPTELECCQRDNCEAQMTDGHISTSNEQSVQECLSVSEESSGNKMLPTVENCQFSNECDLPDAEAGTASEELLTQETECTAAVPQVQTDHGEQRLVSDGHRGELLSCAECGASGLYFSFLKYSPHVAFAFTNFFDVFHKLSKSELLRC